MHRLIKSFDIKIITEKNKYKSLVIEYFSKQKPYFCIYKVYYLNFWCLNLLSNKIFGFWTEKQHKREYIHFGIYIFRVISYYVLLLFYMQNYNLFKNPQILHRVGSKITSAFIYLQIKRKKNHRDNSLFYLNGIYIAPPFNLIYIIICRC